MTTGGGGAPVVAGNVETIVGPTDHVPAAGLPVFPVNPPMTWRVESSDRPSVDSVGEAVRAVRDTSLAELVRVDEDSRSTDLDADGLLPSTRARGLFGDERIGPLRDMPVGGGGTPLVADVAGARAAAPQGGADSSARAGAAGTGAAAASPATASPAAAGAAAVLPATETAPVPRAASTDVVGANDGCPPLPPAKPKPKPVKRILPEALSKPSGSFTEQIDAQKKKFRPPAKVLPTLPPARQC